MLLARDGLEVLEWSFNATTAEVSKYDVSYMLTASTCSHQMLCNGPPKLPRRCHQNGSERSWRRSLAAARRIRLYFTRCHITRHTIGLLFTINIKNY